ncbi:MAG: sugar transferase [Victivallaceae bacterium]|nr:sugar transferase [Victivallaceae bacterium]
MKTSPLSSAEREEIIQTLKRKRRRSAVSWKLFIWNFTVGAAAFLKRAMDVVLSFGMLLALAPFFLVLFVLIRLDSPGRVIFKQVRVGKDGRHFDFYKFRSMYVDAEARKAALMKENESADGVIFKMKRDPRVTRMGVFLRKFSVDELPQLFNVLIGDMSLVGPRPPLPYEVARYTLEERKRLHVRPGITCLWQVSGRSDIPFKRQVMLDKEYISHAGVWADFKILLKTIPAVLSGRGAY